MAASALCAGLLSPSASAEPLPDVGFTTTPVAEGLSNPVAVRFAGEDLIFVAEQRGIVKVFEGFSDPDPTTLVDLRIDVHHFNDRGLLGLEVHPDYPQVPWVWVLYTKDALPGGSPPRWGSPRLEAQTGPDPCPGPPSSPSNNSPGPDGCVVTAELLRLEVDPATNRARESVSLIDGQWCNQFPSHSVGALKYGPDGALYAAAGEGASYGAPDYGQFGGSEPGSVTPRNPCGDPPAGVGGGMEPATGEGGAFRAQDLLTADDPVGLDGMAIRVHPETGAALPDNPRFGGDPRDDRIIAAGLRNPFRMTLDEPGRIYLGDVGWDGFEEVTSQDTREFANHGWPCYEGAAEQERYRQLGNALCAELYASGAHRSPDYAYPHRARLGPAPCRNGSVISGLSLGGLSYPAVYRQALFFADAFAGCVYALARTPEGELLTDTLTRVSSDGTIVDIQRGPGGRLFLVDLAPFTNPPAGRVLRLETTRPIDCPGAGDNDPYEPNGNWDSARELRAGTYDGLILCPGDEDWYSISARRGQSVYYGIEPTDRVDVAMDFGIYGTRRPAYDVGLAIERGRTFGFTEAAVLARDTGRYRLEVLQVRRDTRRYRISPRVCTDDNLGNGMFARTKRPVPPYVVEDGVPVRAARCSWQSDIYAFDAVAGARVRIHLRRPGESDGTTFDIPLSGPPWDPGYFVEPDGPQSSSENEVTATYRISETRRYYFEVLAPRASIANVPYTLTVTGMKRPAERQPLQLNLFDRCRLLPVDERTIGVAPALERFLKSLGFDPPRTLARLC